MTAATIHEAREVTRAAWDRLREGGIHVPADGLVHEPSQRARVPAPANFGIDTIEGALFREIGRLNVQLEEARARIPPFRYVNAEDFERVSNDRAEVYRRLQESLTQQRELGDTNERLRAELAKQYDKRRKGRR